MSYTYVPAKDAEAWKGLLVDPEKQWKRGFSARALAYCWQEAEGFPASVASLLCSSGVFVGPEPLLVFPEHQVRLPGGSRPSQCDAWILARSGYELISIAVEGKVRESFGPTLQEWLRDASPGKQERLEFLAGKLGLQLPLPPETRYQLVHRAASAIIEAERFTAQHAVLVVHSFSQADEGFSDFEHFVGLFGQETKAGDLVSIGQPGVSLHLGWARGEPRYLDV